MLKTFYLKDLLALMELTTNCFNNEFLQFAKEDVKYSKSYAYFLIDFAILCMEFPKLKTVAFPIRSIRTYFSFIKDMVKKESQFWK